MGANPMSSFQVSTTPCPLLWGPADVEHVGGAPGVGVGELQELIVLEKPGGA
jgi:hypothetical protein